jgi:hypothetical protein
MGAGEKQGSGRSNEGLPLLGRALCPYRRSWMASTLPGRDNPCYFDETKCAEGLQSTGNYHSTPGSDTNSLAIGLCDHHSHGDAFRYLAVAIKEDKPAASARGIRMSGWRA